MTPPDREPDRVIERDGMLVKQWDPPAVPPAPPHCYDPVPYLATEENRHDVHTRQLEQVGWFAGDGRFYPLGDQPLGGRAPMGFAPCYVEIGDE